MFKSKVSIFIEKDSTIIECKKLAKRFFHSYKAELNKKTLMQCQDLAAIQLGYQDYFDLHNTIKRKYEFLGHSCYELEIELFDQIIVKAVEKKIDYIQIQLRNNVADILFYMNGSSISYMPGTLYTKKYIKDFCQTVIYHLCDLSKLKPQSFKTNELNCLNSMYSIFVNDKEVQLSLEIKSMPIYPDGYDFFIKPYVLNQKKTNLKQLQFETNQINQLQKSLSQKNGCVMMGGGNFSGRTSTLKALIEYMAESKSKTIYHLSQPIEFNIDNVNNINIQETEYNYFPYVEPMKTALNNNAEVVFMDKINGKSTTQLVYEAAKKALVVSTVNATGMFGVLSRFKDGGLDKEQIGELGFLKLIGYQKLLPVVCDKCYHKVDDINNFTNVRLNKEYKRFFKVFKEKYPEVNINNIKIRNAHGCEHCHNTGIMGRTVCAEIMEIDDNILNYIRQDKLEDCKKYYKSFSDKKIDFENMQGKSVVEHALYKMLQGYLDPLDIEMHFLPIEEFINHT